VTGSQASHITETYRDGGAEITHIYAVNEDISRELDRRIKKPAGKHLQAWLEKKGCRLDSSDGLAVVWHGTPPTARRRRHTTATGSLTVRTARRLSRAKADGTAIEE
jgi:hypothetical protein